MLYPIEVVTLLVFVNIWTLNILYLENEDIVYEARWYVRPDINMGATII